MSGGSNGLEIGDPVLPNTDRSHDVMTVYDFELGGSIALCNWVVGTRMFKAKYACSGLTKLGRIPRRKGSA